MVCKVNNIAIWFVNENKKKTLPNVHGLNME